MTNGVYDSLTQQQIQQSSSDKICFNFGKELYVYSYRGVKKVRLAVMHKSNTKYVGKKVEKMWNWNFDNIVSHFLSINRRTHYSIYELTTIDMFWLICFIRHECKIKNRHFKLFIFITE